MIHEQWWWDYFVFRKHHLQKGSRYCIDMYMLSFILSDWKKLGPFLLMILPYLSTYILADSICLVFKCNQLLHWAVSGNCIDFLQLYRVLFSVSSSPLGTSFFLLLLLVASCFTHLNSCWHVHLLFSSSELAYKFCPAIPYITIKLYPPAIIAYVILFFTWSFSWKAFHLHGYVIIFLNFLTMGLRPPDVPDFSLHLT